MKIRLAEDRDFAALARLHRQTIRNVNSKDYSQDIIDVWSSRTNAGRFRSNAAQCIRWVAVENEKVIGFCDHDYEGELSGLYIHKDYVGKGVGTKLLKVAEDSLKKIGFDEVTVKSTLTAKNFYEKHGYKIVEKTMHKMGEVSVPIYKMNKRLS